MMIYRSDGGYNVTLANAVSNATEIENHDGEKVNVTLADRTLTKDGNWNTLCLPFNVTIAESPLAGDDVVAKVFDNTSSLSSTGELTLKFSDAPATITAGTPFIIKWDNTGMNLVNPVFSGVTISNNAAAEVANTNGDVKFVGQYSPFAIDDSNINSILYVASGNQIGYSSKARTLKCFRAHFWVKPNDNGGAGARSFVLDFGENAVTSIHNSQFIIHNEADAWYTLDGRKLDKQPTQKGVYIHNGRKTVIK